MDDLDRKLALLAAAPLPSGLDGLEDRVLARLQSLSIARGPSLAVSGAGAAIFALALGMGTGGFANRNDPVRSELTGVSGQSEYALSALLGV